MIKHDVPREPPHTYRSATSHTASSSRTSSTAIYNVGSTKPLHALPSYRKQAYSCLHQQQKLPPPQRAPMTKGQRQKSRTTTPLSTPRPTTSSHQSPKLWTRPSSTRSSLSFKDRTLTSSPTSPVKTLATHSQSSRCGDMENSAHRLVASSR